MDFKILQFFFLHDFLVRIRAFLLIGLGRFEKLSYWLPEKGNTDRGKSSAQSGTLCQTTQSLSLTGQLLLHHSCVTTHIFDSEAVDLLNSCWELVYVFWLLCKLSLSISMISFTWLKLISALIYLILFSCSFEIYHYSIIVLISLCTVRMVTLSHFYSVLLGKQRNIF